MGSLTMSATNPDPVSASARAPRGTYFMEPIVMVALAASAISIIPLAWYLSQPAPYHLVAILGFFVLVVVTLAVEVRSVNKWMGRTRP